jgi:TamB, inner membrane protein subunit of TAM complex
MTGRGQGFLNMDINQFGDFAMYGVVEVLQGDYLFTLKNLVNKPFKNATGSIAWYGDPYEADINLSTTYSVSASLYELMPGEDERYKQRVPVDLTLHLTDNLMRPNIGFDILLPTVDQLTRSRVESVLANVEEKNRQAFALLVLQRFISPPNVTKEKSGGIGLAENTSELVSSQLSNWLSQISNDFNLGFNYRPGDEISNDEIALALSTQLFDERLMLSTNVGVSRGSSSNQNPSTLIGDIRVEYKITSEGKIRLMVYNESNDFNIASTQQSLYTQGVGVIYQEEFDTMDEFFCQFGNLLRRRNNRNLCP